VHGDAAARYLIPVIHCHVHCKARSILLRAVTVCSLHCSPLPGVMVACITCRHLDEQIGDPVMA
jgi:hypothetical protein